MSLPWIGLLQCLSGVAAVVLVLRLVFGYARKKKSPALWTALIIAIGAEIGTILLSLNEPDAADLLQETLTLICTVSFPYMMFRCGRKSTFLLFSLAYCATVDYFVTIIPTKQPSTICLLIDIIVCLLAIGVHKANIKAPPESLDRISAWIFNAVFIADLSAYYSGMLNKDASYYAGVSVVLKVFSLAMICVSVLLIVRKILVTQRAERIAAEQLALQLRHYEDLVEKNQSVRAFRHDYENNLLSLGALLDSGQTEDARDYVHKLQCAVHTAAYTFTTGNYLADAILSDKAVQAQKGEVQISFDGTVPEKGVDNPDLCTILCNLLDNAIRGCQNCAPCSVELTGRETADRWLLTVRNPVSEKVRIKNGTIQTSKTDKENHGIGLANIRRTAAKYNGYVELQCDDRAFTAEVGLMLHKEEIK